MASEESINKMIRAIVDKRRELGLVDWGVVPVEEVVDRLNRHGKKSAGKNLAQDGDTIQNNKGTLDPQ